LRDTVTLYKTNQPPVADSLIGIDTATYRSKIQIRADEPFGFEFLDNSVWLSTTQGINDVDNPAKVNTHSIPSVKQKSQFRTLTTSGCGNSVPAPEWTLFWVKTQSDNQKISLSWPKVAIPFLQGMRLLRNGLSLLDLTGKADTSFVDSTNLLCGETYCYQILTRLSVPNHSGTLIFLSAPICAKAISTRPPDAVSNLTATVTDSGIELSGIGSALAKTFELFRKEREGNDPFEKIREAENLPILDTSALFNTKVYCYKISYRDVCGNQSYQSDTVCPILLTLNTVGESIKNFSWTSFVGWKGELEGYELIRTPPLDAPQILDMETRLSYRTIERDPVRQKIYYQIKAKANSSSLYPDGSYSNKVENVQNSKLKFPEVFTPNNDGFNDSFRCYSLFVTNYELRIYNAWGNIIFASQTISEGWSGNINSKPAPSGPYAYWASGTDQEGNVIETKGFFNLAR